MRLKKESFIKGLVCHVYNHSIPERNLFPEKEDYQNFLCRLEKKKSKYPVTILSYCLMPNHYHFMIRQESDQPLYKLFNDCFSGYVQHYNRKYKRKGRLFQNALQHIAVSNTAYLIQLAAYIHYNPVKAGFIDSPENWEFCNFPNSSGYTRVGLKGFKEFQSIANIDLDFYRRFVINYPDAFEVEVERVFNIL